MASVCPGLQELWEDHSSQLEYTSGFPVPGHVLAYAEVLALEGLEELSYEQLEKDSQLCKQDCEQQ